MDEIITNIEHINNSNMAIETYIHETNIANMQMEFQASRLNNSSKRICKSLQSINDSSIILSNAVEILRESQHRLAQSSKLMKETILDFDIITRDLGTKAKRAQQVANEAEQLERLILTGDIYGMISLKSRKC